MKRPTDLEKIENLKIFSSTSTTAKQEAWPPRIDWSISPTDCALNFKRDLLKAARSQKLEESSGTRGETVDPKRDCTWASRRRPCD